MHLNIYLNQVTYLLILCHYIGIQTIKPGSREYLKQTYFSKVGIVKNKMLTDSTTLCYTTFIIIDLFYLPKSRLPSGISTTIITNVLCIVNYNNLLYDKNKITEFLDKQTTVS